MEKSERSTTAIALYYEINYEIDFHEIAKQHCTHKRKTKYKHRDRGLQSTTQAVKQTF